MRPVDRIIAACETAVAEGATLVSETWGLRTVGGDGEPMYWYRSTCCCPLGAVLHGLERRPGVGFSASAADALGVDLRWVGEFIGAIDGGPPPPMPEHEEGYQAGLRVKAWMAERGMR